MTACAAVAVTPHPAHPTSMDVSMAGGDRPGYGGKGAACAALALAQAERGNDDAAQKPPLLPHCRAFVANGQTTAALMVASKTRASVSSTSSPSHMLRCLLLPVLAAPKQRLMLGTLRCPRDQLKFPSKWTIEVHNWWAVGCQGVPVLIMNDNASNYVKPRL